MADIAGPDAQAASAAFAQLRPICAHLLQLRSQPQQLCAALGVLQGVLDSADPAGLVRCFDYVAYPLGFMLQAAAAARGTPGGSQQQQQSQARVNVPAMSVDAAAEAALLCVRALLRQCPSLEADQLAPLLQHACALLQLPRAAVSEEMRLACCDVITAALDKGHRRRQQQSTFSQPHTMALAGFLVVTCLSAAEAEVAAGAQGSKGVRQAAVRVLAAVVAAVGPGPQLAFLLPGIASGLTKQLMASVPAGAGASVVGAAAGSTGVTQLLQLLASVVVMTLGDAAVAHIPEPAAAQEVSEGSAIAAASAADALGMLQQLSLQASGTAAAADDSPAPAQPQEDAGEADDYVLVEAPRAASSTAPRQLTAQQDAAWLATSSSKVQALLALTFPRLLTHPQPAVRQALAAAAAELLQRCSRALANSRVALTEVLLSLANDEYPQVARAAVACLQHQAGTPAAGPMGSSSCSSSGQGSGLQLSQVAARLRQAAAAGQAAAAAGAAGGSPAGGVNAAAGPLSEQFLADLLLDLLQQLPGAVRQNEAAGMATAKRTTAALLCAAGSPIVSSSIFCKPLVLQQVCSSLVAAFQVDPTGAALLLRAQPLALGDMPSTAAPGDSAAARPAGAAGAAGAGAAGAGAAAAAAAGTGVGVSAGHVLLPRMPLSLQHLISRPSYKAAADVARALGRAARLADKQQQSAPHRPGASQLQLLVEALLQLLQAAASPHKQHKHSSTAADASRPPVTPAAGEWQCSTAAVAVVLTEVLFGASSVWQPPIVAAGLAATTSSSSSDGATAAHGGSQQRQLLATAAPFEAVLHQAVAAFTQRRLWELPTAQPAAGEADAAGGSRADRLPAQVLGANALLLHCLIDGVGAAARCAGLAFSSSSARLLRTSLLPLLERLADPCPLVASAAAGALASICRHTGYPLGLSQLVGANADYVVDGVCRQLRSLQQHPHAPQLLAALLREAGVSAALLPLLAEPLRAALSGVSILARQQQPGYVLPFLHVLQSVAAGATLEAQDSRQAFAAKMQEAVAAADAAGLFAAADDAGSDSDDDEAAQDDESGEDSAAARYFKRRLAKQAEEAAAGGVQDEQQQTRASGRAGAAATPPPATAGNSSASRRGQYRPLPPAKKLHLAGPELEALDLTWRRAYSAASLASAAVDAATPLLLQRSLRCAVLAVQVLGGALTALAAATEAVDTEERLFEDLADRGRDAGLRPARPAPPKLLPAVHTIWPLLVAALQDTGSVALLEQQLALLAQMVQLAGGKFMARRFRQDAWPLLQRLLRSGPQAGATALAAATASGTSGGGAAAAVLLGVGGGPGSSASSSSGGGIFGSALRSIGAAAAAGGGSWNQAAGSMVSSEAYSAEDGGPMAPATLQRVQVAVLTCLQGICASNAAAPALHQGQLVWDACVLAAPFLADSHVLALREAAAKLLVAAADVNADAVWLLLLDLASCHSDVLQLLAEDEGEGQAGEQGVQRAAARLPKLPPPGAGAAHGGRGSGSSSSLERLLRSSDAASSGKRAAALLPRVASARVAWHARAQSQLQALLEEAGQGAGGGGGGGVAL